MRLFKDTNYDFIGTRKYAYIISGSILILGILFYFIRGGFNWGIDFQGGIKLQVKFANELNIKDLETIRNKLNAEVKSVGRENKGFIIQRKLPDFVLEKEQLIMAARKENMIFKDYGKAIEYFNVPGELEEQFKEMFKLDDRENKPLAVNVNSSTVDVVKTRLSNLLTQAEVDSFRQVLTASFPDNKYDVEGISLVGPSVGKKYQQTAFYALFFALIGILIYISFRFEFVYSLGAILALMHDVLITLTVFLLLNKEVNLSVVVALLTLIGYSLNDTIVVDDRIRETRKYNKGSLGDLINSGINKTLSRTIMTSLTTFMVVFCLYIFAGPGLHEFSLAFLVGIITGTYSSIYIAAPVVLEFEKKR
ncbi:protein translocase subunit SecF [bacterium]|nr:protein translocase subunit SecF [bacterium]